jgi:phosphoribosyl 1,2-cyclic phosphodiesterase
MSWRFTVLASGSSGNTSLLEAGGFGVLIDAGLGPRQLDARLSHVSASWQHIDAVLITHVHGDHWNERTLLYLYRRKIPLYCHPHHRHALAQASAAFVEMQNADLVRLYEPDLEFHLSATVRCRPLAVSHDGSATCAFRFEGTKNLAGHGWSLGYATDLGTWDDRLVDALGNVDILALEFNHDVDMQLASGRPPQLIQRVLSDAGHLSNRQAAALVQAIVERGEPGRVQHLVQLHLSRDCNRPALARAAVQAIRVDAPFKIHVARQHRTGPSVFLSRHSALVRAFKQPCFHGWEV